MTSRRTLLKAGLFGGALLAVGGVASRFTGRVAADDRREVLAAIIPALLEGALPIEEPGRSADIDRTLAEVESTIEGLPGAAQSELARLFALAAAAPSRRLLTGLDGPWTEADTARIAQVLRDWRLHRLSLLQSAYNALHDLVLGTWYANERHWAAIGYPGPPEL